MHKIKKPTNDLNYNLTKSQNRAFQWKMSFNPNISRQVHEFLFSRDRSIECSPSLTFNNILIPQTNSQNLGMYLDKKLNFEKKHLSQFELKGNKIIGIIPKLQNVLPRSAF